jgi:two-component system nitrogen regulation sensor histidine kinase NtrY
MTFNISSWRIILRVLLLFITLTVSAFLLVTRQFTYMVFVIPLIIFLVFEMYRFLRKAQDELSQFVESVHYRDFSRNFDVKHAPEDLKPMRKGFNDINSTFKIISKEKETQYLYLQKILELVDTGILSYHVENGEVMWMNESLKKMLQLPYLKTIHSLSKRDEELFQSVISLKPGDSKVTTAHVGHNSFKVLLSATAFQTDKQKFILVAFQNVNEALDENEAKAWQKLLSVMTHEIMNSVAPISSLADTLRNRMWEAKNVLADGGSSMDDLEIGIETIKRRSEGLLKFAETYRNLNKITKLNKEKIFVRDLFENINQLMQPTLEQKKIDLEIVLKDTDFTIEADPNLIEQVLINLVVNSIEAVKNNPDARIVLWAYFENKKEVIKISDNGSGMPAEVLEKIFIPFFTTKKSGSGIGLSFCKQIIMLHKGTIQCQSVEGKGTAFLLQF